MTRWAILILLGAPGLLLGQDPRLQRLEPALATLIQAQLDSARAGALPVEPLIQKALEGRGKGAPADRIVAAVRGLRITLERSRATLGGSASQAEVISGANAIRAGASPGMLAQMRQSRSGSLQVALDVLTDLIARGVPVANAGAAVERLVRQGTDDRDLLLLRQRIDQDIRSGATPDAALERRLAGIPAAGPPRP